MTHENSAMRENGNILVISNRPLLREGVKLIIKDFTFTVIIVSNELSASRLISKYSPSIIVVDRPNTKDVKLDRLFRSIDYPIKVVVIGWDDDKIAIFSRTALEKATRENLIKVIIENFYQTNSLVTQKEYESF